jgi:small multidrug resistance pump
MKWFYLALAIIFEVAGTTSMKLSEGFSKLFPSVAMMLFYILSLAALTMALKKIDMSMAYAIWAGIGTALIAIIGVILFKEELSLLKVASILLIIIGVVGLHLSSKGI